MAESKKVVVEGEPVEPVVAPKAERRLDEAEVEGGKYLGVDGRWHDAHGNEIKG